MHLANCLVASRQALWYSVEIQLVVMNVSVTQYCLDFHLISWFENYGLQSAS